MSSSPTVSFCIPNYNNGPYLRQCLQSIVDQTYPNIEIVVVDDASTDNSRDIIADFPCDTVIHNPFNHGQGVATSQAIFAAKGKYCVVMHSDDYVLPHFCSHLLPLLEANPDAGLAAGERHYVDAKGDITYSPPLYDDSYHIPSHAQAEVFLFTCFLPCQVIVRRDLLLKIGMADPNYETGLDRLLWFKCALHADVLYSTKVTSAYRLHPTSTTSRLHQAPDHMAKMYATLKEMHRAGIKAGLNPRRFAESERQLAKVTLRDAPHSFLIGNYDVTKAYLKFANLFDPAIASHPQYQLLELCMNDGLNLATEERAALYRQLSEKMLEKKRTKGYPPPEGAAILEMAMDEECIAS